MDTLKAIKRRGNMGNKEELKLVKSNDTKKVNLNTKHWILKIAK